jgi:predicted transcriptional regulator YdeE
LRKLLGRERGCGIEGRAEFCAAGSEGMSYETKMEGGFTVMGIFTLTSNASPEKIGDLWRRFHAAEDFKLIEARKDDVVYCVYCEYEGDATQQFTVVLGCEVAPGVEAPEGMATVTIAPGEFAVFPVAFDGPIPAARAWQKIWEIPLKRRYQADYDRYGVGTLTIHVGIQ